jgi:hypothetical protein
MMYVGKRGDVNHCCYKQYFGYRNHKKEGLALRKPDKFRNEKIASPPRISLSQYNRLYFNNRASA